MENEYKDDTTLENENKDKKVDSTKVEESQDDPKPKEQETEKEVKGSLRKKLESTLSDNKTKEKEILELKKKLEQKPEEKPKVKTSSLTEAQVIEILKQHLPVDELKELKQEKYNKDFDETINNLGASGFSEEMIMKTVENNPIIKGADGKINLQKLTYYVLKENSKVNKNIKDNSNADVPTPVTTRVFGKSYKSGNDEKIKRDIIKRAESLKGLI